jgi:hypothetical protein
MKFPGNYHFNYSFDSKKAFPNSFSFFKNLFRMANAFFRVEDFSPDSKNGSFNKKISAKTCIFIGKGEFFQTHSNHSE